MKIHVISKLGGESQARELRSARHARSRDVEQWRQSCFELASVERLFSPPELGLNASLHVDDLGVEDAHHEISEDGVWVVDSPCVGVDGGLAEQFLPPSARGYRARLSECSSIDGREVVALERRLVCSCFVHCNALQQPRQTRDAPFRQMIECFSDW